MKKTDSAFIGRDDIVPFIAIDQAERIERFKAEKKTPASAFVGQANKLFVLGNIESALPEPYFLERGHFLEEFFGPGSVAG